MFVLPKLYSQGESMEDQNSAEWSAPPPPERIEPSEQAQISEVGTLGTIFFEPGRTFEDLRRKPRFVLGLVILALLVTAYTFSLQYKIGEAGMRSFIAEQMDKRAPNLTAEQKSAQIDMQMKISAYSRFAVPVFVVIGMLIGGLLYWAGAKAFGGDGGFLHGLSVFIYSSLPPAIVGMIANFIVMALKSSDDIDLALSQRSLVNANLGFFVNGHTNPVLSTVLSTFDIFAIWGWILAAIGLKVTNRLSTGAAWAVVIIIALIGVAFRVIGSVFSGNPS
jgi:hypothetical protein